MDFQCIVQTYNLGILLYLTHVETGHYWECDGIEIRLIENFKFVMPSNCHELVTISVIASLFAGMLKKSKQFFFCNVNINHGVTCY